MAVVAVPTSENLFLAFTVHAGIPEEINGDALVQQLVQMKKVLFEKQVILNRGGILGGHLGQNALIIHKNGVIIEVLILVATI